MDKVIFSINPKIEGASFVCAVRLKHWNNLYPVTLSQNLLCGELAGMGLDQLKRGIVYSIVRETSHRKHLLKKIYI